MPLFWPPEHQAGLAGTATADKLAGGIASGVGAASSADGAAESVTEWHPTVELPTRVGTCFVFVGNQANRASWAV